jgi:hypothetical protein
MFATAIPMIEFHDTELIIHLMARTVPDHSGHPVVPESPEMLRAQRDPESHVTTPFFIAEAAGSP